MASRFIILFYLQFILINIDVLAQSPDIGRIFIGTQGNRSDPTEYTFNSNGNNVQLSLPFSGVVFSGVDGSQTTKDDNIQVTCVNEFSGMAGYTQLTFNTPVNLPAATTEGSVTIRFNSGSVGRAAVVRCYGQSIGAGLCPATLDQNVPQPEFCRETSMSDPVTVTMMPAPVVSICQRVNQVPSFTTDFYNGTFQVVLSEAVRGSDVTVTCTQTSPNSLDYCRQPDVACCSQNNAITETQTVVTQGQSTAMMKYQITRSNSQNSCVGVQCQAVSASPLPEGYSQYVASTSSGSSSQGLFQTVTPAVMMVPQYLTVYNTSLQSVLYLDAGEDVPFQCQASVVNTMDEALHRTIPANIDCNFIFANITTTPAATPATTTTTVAPTTTDVNAITGITTLTTTSLAPTPPVDPSSPWISVDNSFTITSSDKYHVVRTSRELLVIAPVQEIVITTCCSTTSNINSAYRNLRFATATVADLKPRMNSTGGVTSGQYDMERFVVNPAYREVAPCPCDLTYLACDINCCCDGECTDAEKQTFSACIPGLAGGLDPGPDLRNCKSGHFPKDDWFPLLCVQFESNALLGEFYTSADKLNTATDIRGKLIYTYREAEVRFSDLAVVSGYTKGSNILTIYSQGSAGNLLLPQRSSSGLCLDSTPVHFQCDSQSTCVQTLTQATCADLTPFSARVYVQSSSLYNPACPRSFSISSTGHSLQEKTQHVDVKVNYYCTSDSSAYLKSITSTFSDLVSSQTMYSFTSGLQNVSCTDLCGADSVCLDYNQGLGQSGSRLPPRCSTDNSFVLPPTPTFNATTGSCDNVVLDVQYNFTWAGQTITGLVADIILGNVALGSGEVSISQKFAASFVHDYAGASNQSDNFASVTTPYQRSGRPGYDYGKPVATGCNTTNLTTSLPAVDQSDISQMAVWSPGINGLCQNATRRFLTFGDDMQSSCVLRLAFNSINSCDSLKQLVLNHLNILMPANAIGRYGYNSPDINDMWIEILRDDPFAAITEANTTTPSPTSTSTTADPNTMTATDSSVMENATFDPLSVRGGMCRNIISGIHLEIMYAETGHNDRYPLLEIVGAAVRYSVSNWSMSCVGPNSVRCENNSVFTQPFLLHSSVQYTRVSPKTPQKPILFYQIHNKENCDSDNCYRFYEDFDTSLCHYDTCWHELFFPLTQGYQGYESIYYTRGFSLVFVVFTLGYFSVTKPWK